MEPIAQLKEKLQLAQGKELEQVLETLRADERKGAQVLLANWEKKREKEKAEQARLLTLLQYEKELYQEGCRLIAGIDEIRRFSPGLGRKVAERQHARAHHKLNKLLTIAHHAFSCLALRAVD